MDIAKSLIPRIVHNIIAKREEACKEFQVKALMATSKLQSVSYLILKKYIKLFL